MKYNKFGNTGLLVSELSYGTFVNFSSVEGEDGHQQLFRLMKTAYEGGVNTFDTAEAYGDGGAAEILLGQALQEGFEEKVWEREDLVIITKIFFGSKGLNGGASETVNKTGLSRKHVIEGLRNSLKRLKLDYVDVVMAHRHDPVTPIEEVVRAFNQCIDMGLAFYWGTSEWSAQELQEANQVAARLGLVPPCAEQAEYSLLKRTRVECEYPPLYRQGLGLSTWSPLCNGVLTGKYKDKEIPENARLSQDGFKGQQEKLSETAAKAETVRPIAEKLGCSMSQVALAWCLKHKFVSTVIMGASTEEQMQENLGAVKIVDQLTPDMMQVLDGMVKLGTDNLPRGSMNYRTKRLRHIHA